MRTVTGTPRELDRSTATVLGSKAAFPNKLHKENSQVKSGALHIYVIHLPTNKFLGPTFFVVITRYTDQKGVNTGEMKGFQDIEYEPS